MLCYVVKKASGFVMDHIIYIETTQDEKRTDYKSVCN